MDNGWIKLHRKILYNPIAKNGIYAWLWVVLLLKASHKEDKFMWNGGITELKPGQFITGRKKLSLDSGIPQSTVEDILRFLESQQQIRQQKFNRFRLITILNWENFQVSDNQPTTSRQPADTLKNVKKGKNIPERSSETLKDNKKTMKKNSFNYSENNTSDSYDDVIDNETGQKVVASRNNKTKVYWDLLDWSVERRGFKFMNIKKQFKAFSLARQAEIKPNELQNRWTEFEKDKFWKEKGFDWMNICLSFEKKK